MKAGNLMVATVVAAMMVACGQKEKELETGIDLEEAVEMASETPLAVSDFFTKAEYIPLETNDSSLIGIVPHVVVAKDIIVASSLNQPLKIFDRHTGAYIADAGSIGQGPKEYAKGGFNEVNFWVDAEEQLIYVQGWKNDFQVYDKTGKYVNRIEVKDEELYNLFNCYFLMDGNRIWGHTKLHVETEVPSVFHINKENGCPKPLVTWSSDIFPLSGEHLSISTRLGAYVAYGGHLMTIEDGEEKANFYAVNSPSLWKHDGDVRLKQPFNDTIYTVTEDGLKPYEILHLGKWHWEEEDAFRTAGCNDKISFDYILESKDYLYFHLRTGLYDMKNTKVYCGFYDKKNKSVALMEGATMLDEANNQKLSIRGTAADGGFCALIEADKLSEENKSRLELDEEANPVVVIVQP